MSESTNVEVRYPYERHGNAGKKSNSAKSSVMADFLKFLDANSQPNGRSADSQCPTHYFISKFSTLPIPKSDFPTMVSECEGLWWGSSARLKVRKANLVALMDQLLIGFTPTGQRLLSALVSRITAIRVRN